jgi:aromatic-L-amino-acid decarboxylase
MISEDIELARRFHDTVEERPELEAFTQGLSITTYRYVPPDLRGRVGEDAVEAYLSELNQAVQERMDHEGRAFVSNAVLDDRYLLRMCIVNFRTGLDDVEALADISAEAGRAVDGEIRPDELR